MGKTSIEWTDASWNPVVGCTEVSPGCANCYAARLAATRLKNVAAYQGLTKTIAVTKGELRGNPPIAPVVGKHHWTGEVRLLPERLEEPLHWRKPRRIFVCDMGDLFHKDVPDDSILKVWGTMASCQQHTFQVLTKRAQRMKTWVSSFMESARLHSVLGTKNREDAAMFCAPLQNVWLGVSVENQHFADERIPLLLQTPAAVRFVSCEPLLHQVSLDLLGKSCEINALRPALSSPPCTVEYPLGKPSKLDWVICGGESGPGARPMHPDWARSLRDQCQAAGVPFFFKQWGEWAPCSHFPDPPISQKNVLRLHDHPSVKVGKKKAGRLLDGRTWDEFPQVRSESPVLTGAKEKAE